MGASVLQTHWFRRSALFTDDNYDVYTRERVPVEQSEDRAPLHDAHALSDLDARATGTSAPQWGALRQRKAGQPAANEAKRTDGDAAMRLAGAFAADPNPSAPPLHSPGGDDFADALESSLSQSESFHTARGDSLSELGSQELRHAAPNADFARPDANPSKEPAALKAEVHAMVSATGRGKSGADADGGTPHDGVLSSPPPIVVAKCPHDGAPACADLFARCAAACSVSLAWVCAENADGDAASELSDQESLTLSSDELGVPGGMGEPPTDIERRRNLGNFDERPPFTDFEVWRQAEEALQQGVSLPELVRRELQRTLGEDCVECAPSSSSCHDVHPLPHLLGAAARQRRRLHSAEVLTGSAIVRMRVRVFAGQSAW